MGQALQGKIAVVTGGSRGLGRGIVRALVGEGAQVWAIARKPAPLAALAGELPGLHTRSADITDPAAVAAIVREVRPDIIVLNAGATPHMAPAHEQSWDQFSAVWNTDVKSTLLFAQEAMALPLAPGSTVLIISSGAAIAGSPLSGGYAGAKRMQWLLAGYLQQEARQLGRGIRFLAALPRQLVGDTELGATAAAEYARRAGVSVDAILSRSGAPLTSDVVGRQVVALLTDPSHADRLAVTIGSAGIEPL
jgi:NAD(P)-dependent dehydrogenase (short-subunit alcohol dehydrogenase family)